jgi:hypothetical protein
MLYQFEERHKMHGELVPGQRRIGRRIRGGWAGHGPAWARVPSKVAVTDDKTGLSEAFELSTMFVVNLIGTAPGIDSLDTRENGVGLEGGLSLVQKRWVNITYIRKCSSLK